MRKFLALFCLTLAVAGHASAQNSGQEKGAGSTVQGAASGEPAEATRLNGEVMKLYREGKYDEALPLAKRVLEIREKSPGGDDMTVAYALHNVASIYEAKGKGSDAEPLFRRELTILEKHGAADSELAADIYSQLGLIRLSARDYKEAEAPLLRALGIKEKLHGTDEASLVPVLFNLTDLYFLRGEPEQAHSFLGRAVSILARQPPRKDQAAANRLNSYLCPLMGRSAANDKELADKVSNAIWRFEEPEAAARFEKEEKEREARGETDKKIVGGGVLNGRAVSKPAPQYPAAAKQQGVMGTVVVKIVVDESGKVIKADAVCGHPLLAKAAIDAARAARFTPTLLAGMPVQVSGIITYNFVIQ